MSNAIKKITLQQIYDKVSNSDDPFTSFNFEGDSSAITAELKILGLKYFSWGCFGDGLDIIVHNRQRFIEQLLSVINSKSSTKETPTDPINPTHYNGTQTLDRMIAVFGVDDVIKFCEINAFKYRMRAGKKENNPIEQDIKKALWYEGKAKELKRNDNDG